MFMTYPTIEDIERMQEARIKKAEKLLEEAKTEEEKKRLTAHIWMMKNS